MTQPPSLDYAHGPNPPRGNPWRQFWVGLIIGTALSAIVWITSFSLGNTAGSQNFIFFLIALIPIKIVVAIILLCFRNWRSVGGGLLASIALGGLIFFGVCATALSHA
jgi:hypothetical protein